MFFNKREKESFQVLKKTFSSLSFNDILLVWLVGGRYLVKSPLMKDQY